MIKRICVLEDDEGIREIIELLLTEESYDVHGFSNVATFMDAYSSARADLFLLDVRLPDGNGIDVCGRVKGNPQTQNIPVLMMSAHSSKKEIENSCQAEGFIAKPFDIYNFISRINDTLSP